MPKGLRPRWNQGGQAWDTTSRLDCWSAHAEEARSHGIADNIGAEIEKDLEELVAIPIRYAAGPSRGLPPPEQTTGAEVLSTEAL